MMKRLPLLAAPLLAVLGTAPAHAHPLMAEPVNHAHVFTFDQFYLAQDTDAHLVAGGRLLLAELNCTACHAAPTGWGLEAKPGPKLDGSAARFDADSLWRFIRSPQHVKKGTQMPGLFAAAEGDDEDVEALVEFLSAAKAELPKPPAGDAARGKELYHKTGCVACHEPASDYRPESLAADAELERPGNASVPIVLADVWNEAALADFLLRPLAHRPAGRMPDLHLSAQEAADIAAYLHLGRTPPIANERAALKLPKQGVERGRDVFQARRCSACHEAPGVSGVAEFKPVKALVEADPARGCLSASPASGVPRYDLNDLQKRAIGLALAELRAGGKPPHLADAAQRADWQMTRLNCYSCHDRNHKGGPEDPRAQYFTYNDPGAGSLGEFGHLPPRLDGVGRKLTRGWLEKVLFGEGGSVRAYLNTRMPNFGEEATRELVDLFAEADRRETPVAIDVSGLQKHHRAELGRQLLGSTGLACVSCHGLKERKSLGPPVARLTHTVERLQPEYFKELLLNPQAAQPGTMMPPLFMGRKKAEQEIESIWTYLRELEGQPLPEGLLSSEDFELLPAKAGRPIVFRSFIEGAGSHAIGVGFPQGLNAAFDALECRWRLVWRGRFLDAMSNWQSREMTPIKPLGEDVHELPGEAGGEFAGYRLGADGVPVLLYRRDGALVEDTLRPAADGRSFERTLRRNGQETKEVLSW